MPYDLLQANFDNCIIDGSLGAGKEIKIDIGTKSMLLRNNDLKISFRSLRRNDGSNQ